MTISNQEPTNDTQNRPGVRTGGSRSEVRGATQVSPSTRPRSRRGWLAAPLVGLAIIVIATAFTMPTIAPDSASTHSSSIAAIRAAVQQANRAQLQGLASGDPAPMSDAPISLIHTTWGPISMSGSIATATTAETWITTFRDGTTTESSATSVYTLVLQDGKWLISADPQPTSASAILAVTSQGAPQNWSGYAATLGTFTGVSGTWTVPQPTGWGRSVGSTWVGIGGVTTRDLVQAGTRVVSVGGQRHAQTWIGLLPQASHQVPLAVAPGDSVTVSIDEQESGTNIWRVSIRNNTTGQSYQTTVSYTSSQSSAEWIEEAPSSSLGISPLDTSARCHSAT